MDAVSISPEEISVEFRDGARNTINLYRSTTKHAPLILILPALGVRASYYLSFAAHFASHGYHICLADWRGIGASNLRASRKVDFGYEELIQDTREIVQILSKRFSNNKIILLGHSLGGQVGSLFLGRYPQLADGIVLTASGSIYYKGWAGNGLWKIWTAGRLLPLISQIFGYFPGKQIGFAGREGRSVMTDWGYCAKTGVYEPRGTDFDYESAMKQVNPPILAIPVERDNWAPEKAVETLLAKFGKKAYITRKQIPAKLDDGTKLTHFTWAKHPEVIFPYINEWLQETFAT